MTDREKMAKLLNEAFIEAQRQGNRTTGYVADHLVDNGATFQTTPVTYERLIEIARKMHCWIFLNTGDEQEVYDKLGLTDEENAILGYSGQMVISTNDGGLKNG